MADLHIDDFCHDAAKALMQLYQQFPLPQAVYVSDIAGVQERDEMGLHSQRHLACFSTLLWLADEGLLRYRVQIDEEGIEQAVLTHSAFVLLSHLKPTGESNHWITALRQALQQKNSQHTSALIHQLLAVALTLPKSNPSAPSVAFKEPEEHAELPSIEEMFASL